jgi:hypothetical protein
MAGPLPGVAQAVPQAPAALPVAVPFEPSKAAALPRVAQGVLRASAGPPDAAPVEPPGVGPPVPLHVAGRQVAAASRAVPPPAEKDASEQRPVERRS